jgi:hypothetical protein
MKLHHLLLAFGLSAGLGSAAKLPLLIEANEDVSAMFPGAPKIHSFVSAEWEGKWIFIAGRMAGYHGDGGKDADFPRAGANTSVWVVEPPQGNRAAKTYSLAVSKLPANLALVRDQWMSSNPEAVQVGETLYITGGYGQNSEGKWVTYPVLSSVHLPSLVKAVMGQVSFADLRIQYVQSEAVQVSGGELVRLDDGMFYLVGGHKFMGSYRDFEAGGERNSGTVSQVYTSAIRKLKIDAAPLAVTLVEEFADPEFRRRDLNVALTIGADGKSLGAAAFGGVFTAAQLGFSKPVYWNAKERPKTEAGFDQKMSAYTCAHVGFFDPDQGQMLTTFFGGISGWLWSDEKSDFAPAPKEGEKSSATYRDGLQWIDRITTVARNRDGSHLEMVQAENRLGGYVGANGVFLPVANLGKIRPDADVFDLRPLKGKRTLIGYLFGGIRAFPRQFPYRDDSPDYRSGNVPTRASELVLAVYLTASKAPAISE